MHSMYGGYKSLHPLLKQQIFVNIQFNFRNFLTISVKSQHIKMKQQSHKNITITRLHKYAHPFTTVDEMNGSMIQLGSNK